MEKAVLSLALLFVPTVSPPPAQNAVSTGALAGYVLDREFIEACGSAGGATRILSCWRPTSPQTATMGWRASAGSAAYGGASGFINTVTKSGEIHTSKRAVQIWLPVADKRGPRETW